MYKLRLGQSYLSLGAFVCYAITLLFFIICFCSNHWWYFRLDGKVINMGLWTGCWQSDSGQTECSKAIFDNKVFKTGGGSDWYHGTRILMTCALIAIFLQEFALIGFLCINELDRYRQKLAGAVLGFSFVTVFLLLLNFLITAPEVNNLPSGSVGWSFGLTFFCILSQAAIGVAIFMVRRNERESSKIFNFNYVNEAEIRVRTSKKHVLESSVVNPQPLPYPRDDLSFSYRSSSGSLAPPIGSYCNIPDNLSIDTVSTDVVKYSKEPGSSLRGQLEWDV
uniref:Uncharacterized protein LOC111118062 isoform X1 n=1 Tax=Crassostrea virginica TaxID=6565 RepID=A0A8B8CBL1_CRAVI|nr:uncharacterized protein LOC111118062 isoform X1 [Crassostrea virginica]